MVRDSPSTGSCAKTEPAESSKETSPKVNVLLILTIFPVIYLFIPDTSVKMSLGGLIFYSAKFGKAQIKGGKNGSDFCDNGTI